METGILDPTRAPMLPDVKKVALSWVDYYSELQQAILDHVEREKPWRPPVKPADYVEDDVPDFPPPPLPPPDEEMDADNFGLQVRRMQKAKAQADAWVAASDSIQQLEPYQPTMPPEMPGSLPEEDHSLDDPPELPGLSAWFAAIDYDYNKLQKAILDHIEKGKPWPPYNRALPDRACTHSW